MKSVPKLSRLSVNRLGQLVCRHGGMTVLVLSVWWLYIVLGEEPPDSPLQVPFL